MLPSDMRPRGTISSPRSQFITNYQTSQLVNSFSPSLKAPFFTHESVSVTVDRDRKIPIAVRTNKMAGFVTFKWSTDSLCFLSQLTVTPDAVSAPGQNCRTVGVLHNLQNNISQVRYQYLLLSCDTASTLLVTSCLYLLAQSRSSRIKVSPSSMPNTAIKKPSRLTNNNVTFNGKLN